MNFPNPSRTLKKLGRLEMLVAASIVVLATVLFAAHRYQSDQFDRSRDWSVAVDTLRVRLTESHLWLEERISGDKSVDVDRQIFGNIDVARAQCRGLTEGARSARVDIPRLPAGEARRATATACRELVTLRSAAGRRLDGSRNDIGEGSDQAYDRAFERVLALTREAERATGRQVHEQQSLLDRVNVATIVFLVLLLGAIVVVIRRGQGAASEARHLLSAANDAILIASEAGVISAANPVARELLGAGLKGRPVGDVLPSMGSDPRGWPERSEQALERGDATVILDVGSSITTSGPRAERFLILRDITASKQSRARLERSMSEVEDRSRRDPLTGLLNHREFHEGVRRAADRAARDGSNFSVVLFDVDGFKRVNDDYGHAEGDRLLRRLAATLTQSARAEDLVCRVGGDEFAILLVGSDAIAARTVGLRIQQDIDALQAGVGISFGISDWATDGPVTETMLLRADVALYAAKRSGFTKAGATVRSRSRSAVSGSREDEVISRMLVAAREHIGVDVVFHSEFADGHQVFRTLEGDARSFGLEKDAGTPLEQTYCQQMITGRLPNLITDTRADPRVRHLAVTEDADIGAYLGVPLQLTDGSVYGALCCVSHTADPSLGERDVAYMRLLAQLIADHLEDRARGTESQRRHSGEAAIGALLSALAARDNYTGSHSLDVVELARKVAHQLRLSDEQVADVEQVALLHDLGKIGIPDAILQKPSKLDPHEWQVMCQHPVIGAQIIASVSSLSHLAPSIRAEHERFDGQGYPDRLAAERIPLDSRIVFVCDAYHAMVSDRPYRRAMSETDAQAELAANAGTQFDPDVVTALRRVLERLHNAHGHQTSPAHDQAGAPPRSPVTPT